LKGSDEKIAALFNYVKKDVRYVTISLGKSGWIPKTATEVYENKYGDCKDKSTLLIAMLREVGITAHYVLIPTRSRGDLIKEFPYPFQFNHCIVAIERAGGIQYLDPTSKMNRYDYLPAGDQDREVIVIKEGKPVLGRTPLADAYANGTIAQKSIRVKQDGSATLDVNRQYIGPAEASARSSFSETLQTDLLKFFEEIAYENFQGAKLVEYSYSDPLDLSREFRMSMKCNANQYCSKASDMLILPDLSSCGECPAVGPNERKHPIQLKSRSFKRNEVRVIIPVGFDVYSLPESVALDNPYFEYRSDYQKWGSEIFHFNEYVSKGTRVPVEDYGAYREQCRVMKDTLNNRVLLRKQR
jgi:hypothetical protein